MVECDDKMLDNWDSVIIDTVFVAGGTKVAQGTRWAFAEALRESNIE